MATSQKQGIQTLLDAEKESQKTVQEARQYRVQRLKDARSEAEKEIANYRAEKEAEFKQYEESRAGTTQNSQSAIDRETEAKLEEISKLYQQNKDNVVRRLLDRVVLVQPELHRNLRKLDHP